MIKPRNYQELHKDFVSLPQKYRAVPFVRLDGDFSDEETVNTVLTNLKRAGWGGIAPVPVADMRRTGAATTPEVGTEEYWAAYEKLLEKAKKLDMQVVYYDDVDFPSGKYGGKVLEQYPDAHSWILTMREYECSEGEVTRRKLDGDGITVSVVAYELDTGEIIDLREDIMGDTVVWDTPDGNWNILQFICRKNEESPFVNFLNYKASMKFVEVSYKAFTDWFAQYLGDVVKMTWYDDLQYLAQNRRMWSPDFNEVFEREFGFDPAPYYPALYYDIGQKSAYYTACFMKCRAKMFSDGFFRAVSDFTQKFGLLSSGHVSESKNAAISNLTGDAMQFQQYAGAPGADMIHAYMYGFNGLKLASSAAYNYEKEYVTCETYKNYFHLDAQTLYKEAMNCFARGVNCLMPNIMQWSGDDSYNHDISPRSPEYRDPSPRNPEFKDIYPKYTDFLARCQAMLQGGTHIADIAMLYPIDSLHSKVYFYEQRERQFEFPPVLAFADYLSNINAVMNYCGRDVTILHPDVFTEKGRAAVSDDGGVLYLDNDLNPEKYRILILPAMTVTSIRVLRLVRDFYECGGKILATSCLPFTLLEDDEELKAEAADILYTLFGVKEDTVNYVSDYEMHKNDAGGMAIYLRSSMTDLDGTEYVEADRINQTLWKFDTPVDIVFEHLPRIAHSGILALNLIAFKKYGAAAGIRSGGVFNYIHKRHDDCEVYYVSNTTVKAYAGHIVISGCHEVEEWNPHTGKIRQMTEKFGTVGGHAYTTVEANIPENTSVFYVCRPKEKIPEAAKSFENFGALRRYFDEQVGKKTQNKKPHLFGW
ncbi:MAG: hypothetical protein IJ449_10835 [Clostridia bacterium]|nr:hypothetical protein [Clostridia bacterium]